MQDKHNEEILAATKSFLQAAGFNPDLSISPDQPFRLGLIRDLLQLMHDPDTGLIDMAESGLHTGVFETIQFSGIWRRQQCDAREDLNFEIYDTNWKSAEEDPDTMTRLLPRKTSMPSSFRSPVTSLKPRSAGQKGLQLRCKDGKPRPAPLFGQHDSECQCESTD